MTPGIWWINPPSMCIIQVLSGRRVRRQAKPNEKETWPGISNPKRCGCPKTWAHHMFLTLNRTRTRKQKKKLCFNDDLAYASDVSIVWMIHQPGKFWQHNLVLITLWMYFCAELFALFFKDCWLKSKLTSFLVEKDSVQHTQTDCQSLTQTKSERF